MEEKAKTDLFRYLKYLVIFIMVTAVYSFIWGPWATYEASLHPTRTFNVSGVGEVVVKPTIAKVALRLITEGSSPNVTQNQNAEKMNEIIEALKNEGVENEDIKTTQFNLSPKYSSANRFTATFIDGYRLTQEVTVTIRNLELVGEIMARANTLGVNSIDSVMFDITEEERKEFLAKAREEAFNNAKEKARLMARSAGVRLGDIVNFNENNYIPFRAESKLGFGGGADSSVAPSIEPGSQKINVNVNVTYEIK